MDNGLYNILLESSESARPINGGVLFFQNGLILGGDAFFFYVGSFVIADGGWTGQLVTKQHTRSSTVVPAFGGLDLSVSLSGEYPENSGPARATVTLGGGETHFRLNLRMIADA